MLLSIGYVLASALHGYKFLLLEPELTEASYMGEYEIAMHKWYILSSFKFINARIRQNKTKCILDDKNVSPLQVTLQKRIELLTKYMSAVKIQEYLVSDLKTIKAAYLQYLEEFPKELDFHKGFQGYGEEKREVLEDLVDDYYIFLYDKCLTEYIFYAMENRFRGNEMLLLIWHKLIRQLYLDTLCSYRFQLQPGKQNAQFEAIETNAPIECRKSENFFVDTIFFINNLSKIRENLLGFDIISDISPYLILHFIRCAKQGHNAEQSMLFSTNGFYEIMSYLSINHNHKKLMKKVSMPIFGSITSVGYPIEIEDITNIIAFTNTEAKVYKECVYATAAFGYISGYYNKHLTNSCILPAYIASKKQYNAVVKESSSQKFFRSHKTILTILPLHINICKDLSIKLICGFEQSFDGILEMMMTKISSIKFYEQPLEQIMVVRWYEQLEKIKLEEAQDIDEVTIDFTEVVKYSRQQWLRKNLVPSRHREGETENGMATSTDQNSQNTYGVQSFVFDLQKTFLNTFEHAKRIFKEPAERFFAALTDKPNQPAPLEVEDAHLAENSGADYKQLTESTEVANKCAHESANIKSQPEIAVFENRQGRQVANIKEQTTSKVLSKTVDQMINSKSEKVQNSADVICLADGEKLKAENDKYDVHPRHLREEGQATGLESHDYLPRGENINLRQAHKGQLITDLKDRESKLEEKARLQDQNANVNNDEKLGANEDEFASKLRSETGPENTYDAEFRNDFEFKLACAMLDAKIAAKMNEPRPKGQNPDELDREVLALLENEYKKTEDIEEKTAVDLKILEMTAQKINKLRTDEKADAFETETIPKAEAESLSNALEPISNRDEYDASISKKATRNRRKKRHKKH